MTLVARGRDLLTPVEGEAEVLATARLELEADFIGGRISRVSLEPAQQGLDALVGASAYAGFRRAIDEIMPGERQSGSVRYQLIDDLSTAFMLSGRVLRAEGLPIGPPGTGRSAPVDICAGWAEGGVAIAGYTDLGPPLFPAPPSPPIEVDDDPLAWHEHDRLPPHSTRRRRRLDVWLDDGVGRFDCFFRDSHVAGDGEENVVHEYTVRGAVDPVTSEFVSCAAEWGELPFPECPAAVASATRLEGESASGLRRTVLKTFVGPSTCTHLNDQLRSLEDVVPLLARLGATGDGRAVTA